MYRSVVVVVVVVVVVLLVKVVVEAVLLEVLVKLLVGSRQSIALAVSLSSATLNRNKLLLFWLLLYISTSWVAGEVAKHIHVVLVAWKPTEPKV